MLREINALCIDTCIMYWTQSYVLLSDIIFIYVFNWMNEKRQEPEGIVIKLHYNTHVLYNGRPWPCSPSPLQWSANPEVVKIPHQSSSFCSNSFTHLAAVVHEMKSSQRRSQHVPAVNQLQNQSHIRSSPVLNPRHLGGWKTRTLPDILQQHNNISTTLSHSCSIWCRETHSWLCPPRAGILNLSVFRENSFKARTHPEWSYWILMGALTHNAALLSFALLTGPWLHFSSNENRFELHDEF